MDLRARHRAWRVLGFSEREAGNLVARFALGLPPVPGGWKLRELQHLAAAADFDDRKPDVVPEVDRVVP